jgi:hypothetical protein
VYKFVSKFVSKFGNNIVVSINNVVDKFVQCIFIFSYCHNSFKFVHIVRYCQQFCQGLVCRCGLTVTWRPAAAPGWPALPVSRCGGDRDSEAAAAAPRCAAAWAAARAQGTRTTSTLRELSDSEMLRPRWRRRLTGKVLRKMDSELESKLE